MFPMTKVINLSYLDMCATPHVVNNRMFIKTFFVFRRMSSSSSSIINGADLEQPLLRVHSKDLHEHMLQDVADCLQTRSFADMVIRCNDGGGDKEEEIWVHKVVLGAVSPYLRMVNSVGRLLCWRGH